MVKRLEHFWKGLSQDKTQISPVPSVPYGDRFVKFITAVTKSREEAEKEDADLQANHANGLANQDGERGRSNSHHLPNTDNSVIRKAESQALKTETRGSSEEGVPDRTLGTVRSPSADRANERGGMTLPIVDEAGESSSTGGRSGASNHEADDSGNRPPTPPKDKPSPKKAISTRNSSFDSNKALPALPTTTSPEPISEKQSVV